MTPKSFLSLLRFRLLVRLLFFLGGGGGQYVLPPPPPSKSNPLSFSGPFGPCLLSQSPKAVEAPTKSQKMEGGKKRAIKWRVDELPKNETDSSEIALIF